MADRDRLRPMLTAVFDRVSSALAGGERVLPPDLRAERQATEMLPGGSDTDTLLFQPPDFDEPELAVGDGDPFLPDLVEGSLPPDPGVVPTRRETVLTFAPAGDGRFVRFDDGMVRFTRGVGEAPNNKANRSDPLYQERSKFVTEMYQYVLGSFDVTGAGQHRHLDAPVSGARSSNSDHYSGGAFDVRASSPEDAQRVLAWASRQPWVSFAQVYPDGTLVHISAYIGYFAENGAAPQGPPAASRPGSTAPRTPVQSAPPGEAPRRRYGQPSPI